MENAMGFGVWSPLIMLIWALVFIVPFWKITSKAGYSGWLSLLMIVPGVNLIFLYFIAFANWPSLGKPDA